MCNSIKNALINPKANNSMFLDKSDINNLTQLTLLGTIISWVLVIFRITSNKIHLINIESTLIFQRVFLRILWITIRLIPIYLLSRGQSVESYPHICLCWLMNQVCTHNWIIMINHILLLHRLKMNIIKMQIWILILTVMMTVKMF